MAPDRSGPSWVAEHRKAFAVHVVRRLTDAGFRALWAGGCVRDLLLGLDPSDYDVATDATPEQVMGLFRRTVPVGASFGVVRVLGRREEGEVEVATFRSDDAYIDGRRPVSVTIIAPEHDAARRDFTINGMFLDPLAEEVIDYVGGRDDLRDGVLRAIGDPVARFDEDKLRLIRAARFAARFGLRIEPGTRRALEAMAPRITVVAAERIAQELRKMLLHTNRSTGMDLLMKVGLIGPILPELLPLRGAPSPGRPDRDLWAHTLAALDALPGDPSFPLALAALLHEAPGVSGAGPAGLVREVSARLKLANADRDRAAWLAEHRRGLLDPRSLPVARLKRLLAEPGIGELLALHRAVAEADGLPVDHVAFCEAYLRDEPDGPIRPPPLLKGDDLKQLGLPPGPAFKRWLDRAYDAQLENVFTDREGGLAWLRGRLDEPPPGRGDQSGG